MTKDGTVQDWLDSQVGPRKGTLASLSAENSDEVTPLAGKTVLVVDSALATRRTLQEQVTYLGARSVLFASTVSEVERYLESQTFALIICEYSLEGGRTGQQLLEELKLQNKLPWFTAFMMVTSECRHSSVLSVAEFEPDDYLIKPFTASSLSKRIGRIFSRKKKLATAFEAMYQGQYDSVPPLCISLEKQYPQYSNELERLRIESIIRAGRLKEAREELKEALLEKPKPWMRLALSNILLQSKEFDHAAKLLEKMVLENPDYICAADLYADVLWEQGNPDSALEVLEKLGAKALSSTSRLRKLADLSLRVGDNDKSKFYLNKVIDRSGASTLTQINDYLQLARIYVQEGQDKETEKLTSRLKATFNPADFNFESAMITIQRLTEEGNLMKARSQIEGLFKSSKSLIDKLQPDAQTCLVEQCFKVGMSEEADELIKTIMTLRPNKSLLDRLEESQKAAV